MVENAFKGWRSILFADKIFRNKKCKFQLISKKTLFVGYFNDANVKLFTKAKKNILIVFWADCGDIAHGGTQTQTMYESETVDAPDECQSEQQTRTCTNGEFSDWSGSFEFAECTVNEEIEEQDEETGIFSVWNRSIHWF